MTLLSRTATDPIDPEKADILDRLSVATWIFDIDFGRVVWANKPGLHLWCATSLDDLSARDMKADMSASVARRLQQYQDDFRRTSAVFSELWTVYPGGQARTVRVLFSGFALPDGRTGMFCEARDDVDLEPERLRSADALLHTQLMISLYSACGTPLYRNPAARAAVGHHGDDLRLQFVEPDAYEDFCVELARAGEVSRILRINTQHGARWHEVTARQCHDAVTGQAAVLVSEVDVSDLKNTQAKAQYLAYHDPLTSLPNRASVPKHFDALIAAAALRCDSIGVLFLDLDNFKVINDSLGHALGDDVLRIVAQRLLDIGRPEMVTIRLGGDEFLVIMSGGDRESYEALAIEALAKLSDPVIVGHHRLNITTSIGISRYPEDGDDGETLMKSADLAMYEAKEAGRNCLRHFSIGLRVQADQRLNLQSDIKKALTDGAFEVYYQPRVSLCNDRIVGAEALVRWNHPERGMISPAAFIPLCEETGLIEELGRHIMVTGMKEQRRLQELGYPLSISINVSQRQLSAGDFVTIVEDALALSGCSPGCIEFEITESMLMERADMSIVIDSIRKLGIKISIDDFGTGYSNLARLHEFAIDCLKIDQGFIARLPAESALTQIIISLCKLLQVKIVAEGVETLGQLMWLKDRGCDEYQGYYFARPLPSTAFQEIVVRHTKEMHGWDTTPVP
ncbi:EAL domain-containing protein [Lichenihabitans sp. Uapishka_5]|uniref:putative bifunctional diguanylate cyclase/phosphodiesterase n=1 Tax=Lichenihabitans sp. Uapishka_5 TaxID=3037302 RepID=UPI0029E7E2A6|nr:EAL domain-containing protein [Lichenihabitans sp. Uapishka_5]MDX7949574.1 EAL domain-containing protein [Lichenihabitans sp. Uapishka_5]